MQTRGAARALLAAFAAALVVGALFPVLTEPGVQGVGVQELVARRSDAVAYFTLDLVFVVVYAVVGPIVLWRFGRARSGTPEGRVPRWIGIATVSLVVGGMCDAVENVLLLGASTSGNREAVDLAHALGWPKYAFGAVGFVLVLAVLPDAWRRARGR
jgi:hypothetical protein